MSSSPAAATPRHRSAPGRADGGRNRGHPLISLAALGRWRGEVYRLLGRAFLFPTPERLERMAQAARRQERAGDTFAGLAIYPRWRSLVRTVRLAAGQAGTLQADFSRLFVAGRVICAPHESHQLALDPAEAAALTAALEREYADEGVTLHPAAGELPDHAAVEMEFVAFLCDRERAAWRNGQEGEGRRLLLRQRQFLRQHLGRWVARFAREVQRADPRGWYGEVAGAAAAFIHHDQDLVDLLLAWAVDAGGGEAEGGGVR